MSDLSSPPLATVAAVDLGSGFAWPVPPLPGYAPAQPFAVPEPCDLEGLNGRTMTGHLVSFAPEDGTILMRVAPTRTALTLRLEQFRRLRLQRPLAPQPPADAAALQPVLAYRVRLVGGGALEGLTVGHVENACGLFLFEPVDAQGSVRRVFLPRAAYRRVRVGKRAGEPLPEQSLTLPEQLDAAAVERERRQQQLGDMLVERQVATPEDLFAAIEQQARMPMVRIGEALVALGFIDEPQLESALERQKAESGVPLGELLVRSGAVTRAALQTALTRKMGYPLVDVLNFPADTRAVLKLPYAQASKLSALPLALHGGRLVVALEDPTRRAAVDEIEFLTQSKVVPVLARAGSLFGAIERTYDRMGAIEFGGRPALDPTGHIEFAPEDAGKLLATLELQGREDAQRDDDDDDGIEQSDNSLVRLINTMILEAQAQGVSDIHVETQPGREKVRIRFRKDGVLRPYMELPHTYRSALLARLKIMCDLDISERRKPQDGKIAFGKFVQGQRLELRVATIPTANGLEDAVLRLLASARPLPLEQLNLNPRNLERLKAAVQRPYGMILCVGPTGSGKTTTLHSALGHINTPERKIWTAEDPVEITQPGLRQVQVNPKIDWTFAKALRAFLRADPDVVMVGEIRDEETARTAIEASLTGHLVLSTLHTNSAPETVTRLLDMGMDPFNFADSLLVVLAQRLVRRLCPDCRAPREASDDEIDELLRDHAHAGGGAAAPRDDVLAGWRERFGRPDGRLSLYGPAGCKACDGSGFRGRTALHELMTVDKEVKRLMQTGGRTEQIAAAALAGGMATLRQDGIEKVLAGLTTLDEVRAATN